jgi:hypothetical protein
MLNVTLVSRAATAKIPERGREDPSRRRRDGARGGTRRAPVAAVRVEELVAAADTAR